MRRICGTLIIAAVAAWSPFALAEDVVHFSNGAEMTVRSHAIEKDMVKLDLGGNSFITFPLSMVDKIVSAGKDVFLNPVYHPSNQALPVAPGNLPSPLPDRTIRGGGVPVGYRLGQSQTGTGLRLGEAANDAVDGGNYGSGRLSTISDGRGKNFSTPQPRRFNSLAPQPIGTKQTIEPPGGSPARTREQIQIVIPSEPAAPPPESDSQPEQAPADPESAPAQDPPESD
jgi:hypothetical protein